MYVSIVRVPSGDDTTSIADPPTLPDDAGLTWTARVCPHDDVDVTTSTIQALRHVIDVGQTVVIDLVGKNCLFGEEDPPGVIASLMAKIGRHVTEEGERR